jgi:hypothetical protein
MLLNKYYYAATVHACIEPINVCVCAGGIPYTISMFCVALFHVVN